MKTEKEHVLHLKYDGADIGDAGKLREELLREIAAMSEIGSSRTLIIEFAEGAMVYSSEIGIMVQFLKAAANTKSVLHIAASETILNILTTMNMHRLPGIMLHKNVEEIAV